MNIANLVKKANPGLPEGVSLPPPPQGATPAGGPAEAGLPPELEQLINSLPPEVLQQLLAEVEQQLGSEAQAGTQPQDQGQMLPQNPNAMDPTKQAEAIVAYDKNYIDGFMSAAQAQGLNKQAAQELYKYALDIMQTGAPAQNSEVEKQAAQLHYEGFTKSAMSHLGLTADQAQQLYVETFNLQN